MEENHFTFSARSKSIKDRLGYSQCILTRICKEEHKNKYQNPNKTVDIPFIRTDRVGNALLNFQKEKVNLKVHFSFHLEIDLISFSETYEHVNLLSFPFPKEPLHKIGRIAGGVCICCLSSKDRDVLLEKLPIKYHPFVKLWESSE